MKTFLVLALTALLSSPALAQTGARLDASATRRAVSAAVAGTPRMSRSDRVVIGVVIGAGAGMVAGWWLWNVRRDCGECGPGPQHTLVSMGALGAGIGALIGAGVGSSPNRRPGIPVSRHLTVDSAVSRSRVGGAVRIAF